MKKPQQYWSNVAILKEHSVTAKPLNFAAIKFHSFKCHKQYSNCG